MFKCRMCACVSGSACVWSLKNVCLGVYVCHIVNHLYVTVDQYKILIWRLYFRVPEHTYVKNRQTFIQLRVCIFVFVSCIVCKCVGLCVSFCVIVYVIMRVIVFMSLCVSLCVSLFMCVIVFVYVLYTYAKKYIH